MGEINEVFGPLFDEGQIETAALETLRLWLPDYLREARRQKDYPEIAPVKSWGVSSEYDRWPEEGLPAVIVMVPGTREDPEAEGDDYQPTYGLSVAVECAAGRGDVARRIAQIYGAAVVGTIMHRRSLGTDTLLRVTKWRGSSNTTVGIDQRRTRVSVEQMFDVFVPSAFNVMVGPTETTEPTEPLPDEWPEVTDADVETRPYGEES